MRSTARPANPARQSIAFRLGAGLSLILLLVVVGTIVAANRYSQAAADETFDRLLRGAALQIAERISVTDGVTQLDLPVSAFELLSLARNDRVFYRVIGPSGEEITGYPDLPVPDKTSTDVQTYDAVYKGTTVRAVRLDRQLAERSIIGNVIVVVAQTTIERQTLARNISTQAVATIAAAGIALVLLTVFAVRLALRPMVRVERAILERNVNDLSPINLPAPAEVAVLLAAINRFMDRLERRIDAMQNFVADAAHQMRTPITAMRAQAQLALDETDPHKLDRLHHRIYARSVGLGRLADQLLSHALVAHRADAVIFEDLDLRRVALDAERETRMMSEEPINIELPDDPVNVRGDPVSLREAVKNLINNALKHGGGDVTVCVSGTSDGRAAVVVRDNGAGIPPDMASRIGERFATGGVDSGSAGLGLSIVAAVARSHGAELIVRRAGQGGFEIGLEMQALHS